MKKILVLIIVIWSILVSGSFVWNYLNAQKERERISFQTARTFFNQIVLSREWNADHGGVYVPVTAHTQPNPYLEDSNRDIEISSSLKLTKINPAFMTRQLSEIAEKRHGVRFHITSRRPIRPENRPTEWEKDALVKFEDGEKESGEYVNKGPDRSFRYMAPLMTRKTCLKCHAKQGYKEGDVRGGISVTLPDESEIPILPPALGHLLIGLSGIGFILFYGRRLDSAYETMRQQSIMDALTGIPNRRYFTERIFQELQRSRRDQIPLSLVICDVDHFKLFNDNYGHHAGDVCLKKIAQTIEESLKRPSDLCARYGGEEFVIVLPNTPIEGALFVAEKIRSNIENLKIEHKASPVHTYVTLSLGAATYYSGDISYKALIEDTDEALYRAKANGRNRVEAFK